jgi:hypothetical protein
MKQLTATSEAATAYGKKLETPINYGYGWGAFESKEEAIAASAWLSDDDILKVVNIDRQANARQKALQAALDAAGIVRPTEENDDQLRLRNMFKTLMSSKRYTEERAREVAADTLGLTWETA